MQNRIQHLRDDYYIRWTQWLDSAFQSINQSIKAPSRCHCENSFGLRLQYYGRLSISNTVRIGRIIFHHSPNCPIRFTSALPSPKASIKFLVPLCAILPRLLINSSRVIPTPLSSIMMTCLSGSALTLICGGD